MLIELELAGRRWRADSDYCFDLAIRLEFDGPQPRFFAEHPASAAPMLSGSFVGSVERGASCNCDVLTLAPHCHGTHTECVGHVTQDKMQISALTPAPLMLAALLSTEPSCFAGEEADRVISADKLAAAAEPWADDPWTGLVVRTIPNGPSKKTRSYAGPCPAPYFTSDAMRWIVQRQVSSLVVDLPSLDRADDGGALAAHREFWGLPPGSTDATLAARAQALVTELAFVADEIPDGLYLLDLQIPAFACDAAPSRPVIYPVTEIET